MKSKITQIVELLQEADKLLGKALRLGAKNNRRFADKIVDIQIHLDDAITLADPKQTLR